MDNLVRLSQGPFQLLSLISLVFAVSFIARVLLSWIVPSFLPEVTLGLILNAVAISTLVVVGVLAMIGEFVIRNFTTLQQDPHYIIREMLKK